MTMINFMIYFLKYGHIFDLNKISCGSLLVFGYIELMHHSANFEFLMYL
jgi:hypothetical protein